MKEINNNNAASRIAEAIAQMKEEYGKDFTLETVNLAELERRTGISRSKLRTLRTHSLQQTAVTSGTTGRVTKLTGYTGMIDTLLKSGVSNSSVILERLKEAGYEGGLTIVKDYIALHRSLIPSRRQQTDPQGSRARRYTTDPGEAYQMDWGFTDVLDENGQIYRVACFAMVCHHCGERYIEFFPNAKQESLFIGMIHAFQYMGIPKYILTDNMKSVIVRRDLEGHPIWQKDYEAFMRTIGFETRVCKPYHPYTKGTVERLIRFVKDNFLADRVFCSLTDLNMQALEWCHVQNNSYRQAIDGAPQECHGSKCVEKLSVLEDSGQVRRYLSPERCISFDGFVNFEGRRYGVPYSYSGKTARVMRSGETVYVYSADMTALLTAHTVTRSRKDSYCEDQYASLAGPEEFPTAPVRVQILEKPKASSGLSFEKFNFDEEDDL